jgi:hypothetical protein
MFAKEAVLELTLLGSELRDPRWYNPKKAKPEMKTNARTLRQRSCISPAA